MVLPINIIAPILTGSVTWTTSSRLTERALNTTVSASTVATNLGWTGWNRYPAARERLAVSAAGYANIAWGRDTPDGWSKRVLRSCSALAINSTVATVRVPYFSVDSIEWIKDPEHSLSASQLDVLGTGCTLTSIHARQQECPIRTAPGTLGLIPKANLTSSSPQGDPFPEPVIIKERRLMVLFSHWRESSDIPCEPVRPANRTTRWISDKFPASVGFYPQKDGGECWAFAWVNFTAGSGNCFNCRISSHSTVQSDDVLEVQPDRMADPALRVMPTAISLMTLMNSSIPSPWRNVEKYVAEVLGRSYAVSWAALVDWAGEGDDRLNSEFSPAMQSSRAKVDYSRVFTWLAIQLLITISGIAFIVLQIFLGFPMIDDTTLVAFYLDTTNLYKDGSRRITEVDALIKVDYKDGRLKLQIE
ncbi:hypothetical protein OPQ81_008500 [Rhizoctonia solani]|nr:hypothetical protein OPQ81_008500 [Rhizoctonia solani]